MLNYNEIYQDEFERGNIRAKTRFAFFLNEKELIDKLRKKRIELDKDKLSELDALAEMSEAGLDLSGFLKDSNGNKIVFDFEELIDSVSVSNNDVVNNNIKFVK